MASDFPSWLAPSPAVQPQGGRIVKGIDLGTQVTREPRRKSKFVQGARSVLDANQLFALFGLASMTSKQLAERTRWPANRLRNALERLVRDERVVFVGNASRGVWKTRRK